MPCKRAKEFLSSKGVPFTDVNVVEDPAGRDELIRRTGQLAVPVILVGDAVVVGFDRPRLSELLGV
jgi:glutaredoxin